VTGDDPERLAAWLEAGRERRAQTLQAEDEKRDEKGARPMTENASTQAQTIDVRNPDGTPFRVDTSSEMAAYARWHRDFLAASFRRLWAACARPLPDSET
jgi:hypothetical protein